MRGLMPKRPSGVPAGLVSPPAIATAILAVLVQAGVAYLVWPRLMHAGAFTPCAPAASAMPLHPPDPPGADLVAGGP